MRERIARLCAPFAGLVLDAQSPSQLDETLDFLLGSDLLPESVRELTELEPWKFPQLGNPLELLYSASPQRYREFDVLQQEVAMTHGLVKKAPALAQMYGPLVFQFASAVRLPDSPPPEVMDLIFRAERNFLAVVSLIQAAWQHQEVAVWLRRHLLETMFDAHRARLILLASMGYPVNPAYVKDDERLDLPRLYREMAETRQRWTAEAHEFARQRASLGHSLVPWTPAKGDVVNVFAGGKPDRPGVIIQIDDGLVIVCLVAFGTGTSPEQRRVQGDPHQPNVPVSKTSLNGQALALDKDTWFYGHKDDRKPFDPDDSTQIRPRPGATRCPDKLLNELIKIHKNT